MELYPDRRPSGTYWKIRESYYEDGKVKKRNVLYLGTAEKIFERFNKPTLEDAELKTVSFGSAATLRWAFEDLGLDELFTELLDPAEEHEFPAWKKVFLLVWRRFFQDLSMMEAVERYSREIFPFWWREKVTTVQRLYQFLGESLDETTLERAQLKLARRSLSGSEVKTCKFDTTDYCTYVSGDTKYLRIGRSKEGVVGRRLVGLALALSDDDTPVMEHAYPGNEIDSTLFFGLFESVCEKLESAGADLKEVTIVFDRGFDDEDNFELAMSSPPHIVAGAKKNRNTVKEKVFDADPDEFQLSHETKHGKCYVQDCGHIKIKDDEWRIVLSYTDSTREKSKRIMDEIKKEAEELLEDLQKRAKRKGRGRPLTEGGIERELKDVLGKRDGCLDRSFDPETREINWRWNDKWNKLYKAAGVHAVITDRDDWTPSKVVRTYFEQRNVDEAFHLTKDALIVPVEPPYVKEDHLIRAHLFLVFVGLLCYHHIRQKLPDEMSDKEVKSAMKELDMVIAVEDGSLAFKLANVNSRTKPLLATMNLERYLPG